VLSVTPELYHQKVFDKLGVSVQLALTFVFAPFAFRSSEKITMAGAGGGALLITYTKLETGPSTKPVPPATARSVCELAIATGVEYKVPAEQPAAPLVAGVMDVL
jgi:hypothetical protein